MTRNPLRILLLGFAICAFGCRGEGSTGGVLEQLTLVEDLRIGSVDDPETALTNMQDVAFGPDNKIYLMQDRDRQVRVFDALGAPDTVIGGAGEGPGEFAMMVDIGFFGDTLFVVDGELRRTSYFSSAGALLATEPLAQVQTGQPRFPSTLFADGTGLGAVTRSSEGWAALFRTRRDGTAQDTFLRWSTNVPMSLQLGDRWISFRPVTPDVPVPAVSPDGRYAYVVERTIATDARDGVFRIHRVTLDGDTTWTREHHYVPVTVPRAEYDSVNARAIERTPELASIVEEANPYVRFRVPVTAAIAADDGSLWLRREEPPGAITVRWDVLSAEGEAVGTTVLPESTRILAVHNGAVYAAVTDDLGVPYLVRYRIER